MVTVSRLIAASVLIFGLWQAALAPAQARARVSIGDTVIVATTEGNLLTLRIGPGTDYAPLAALEAGTALQIIDGPAYSADGMAWFQVALGEITGWCSADWLASADHFQGTLYISGAPGGARLRDAAGLSGIIMTLIPEGAPVTPLGAVADADGLSWALVDYAGATGWVAADFLTAVVPAHPVMPAAENRATGNVATVPALAVGGNALIVDTNGQVLRIRDGIGTTAPIFATVPPNAVVRVVNGPAFDNEGNAWYGINYDGVLGWVFSQHLAPTTAARTSRMAAMQISTWYPGRGEDVVAEALKHVGVPYRWGGDGPAGWDCSGMIQWVYRSVGVNLPRVSQDQFYVGMPVQLNEIQAGDIVFFADTDGPGITHNGIALGDGRFIHARGQQFGTTVSWLNEPFWVEHYAGARRP